MGTSKNKVSVLQGKEKYCYITGAENRPLHRHHIYFGTGLRDISEENGFWCYLIPELHNQSEKGVHGRDGHNLDMLLKRECQKAYEREHTREEFVRLIGRSYL